MSEFLQNHWGDLASVIGLAVSVAGFWYALVSLNESRDASLKAKDAAVRAEESANATRSSIYKADSISNCSQAIAILDEIKISQRKSDWINLPDRYSTVRRILVTLRSVKDQLSDLQVEAIQGALAQLVDIEQKIENSLESEKKPLSPSKLNAIISSQIDKLHEILISLKQKDQTNDH